RRDAGGGLPPTAAPAAVKRLRSLRVRPFSTAGRRRNPARPIAERHPPAVPPPFSWMALAERKQQRARDMLIAREGEELVCPKGTICGRMTRDANDRIIDGDFAVLDTCVSPDGQRYVCACCERA